MDKYNKTEPNKKDFYYTLKLRTAIIGFILYLLLSSYTAFKVLNIIISAIINNLEIINEQKEPTIVAKIIMATLIGIILFIF
jgi:hypothetical protein